MTEIKKKRKLPKKERRFVAEYLKDQNATAAAKRAGYSERSAGTLGARLLKKVGVAEAIDEALREIEDQAYVSAAYVLTNLKEVVERCLQHKPVMKFDPVEKEMVQETAIVERTNEDGTKYKTEEGVWEFDSTGANRALELIGKNLKMFTEKHEVAGKNGGPIQTQSSKNIDDALENIDEEKLLKLAQLNEHR